MKVDSHIRNWSHLYLKRALSLVLSSFIYFFISLSVWISKSVTDWYARKIIRSCLRRDVNCIYFASFSSENHVINTMICILCLHRKFFLRTYSGWSQLEQQLPNQTWPILQCSKFRLLTRSTTSARIREMWRIPDWRIEEWERSWPSTLKTLFVRRSCRSCRKTDWNVIVCTQFNSTIISSVLLYCYIKWCILLIVFSSVIFWCVLFCPVLFWYVLFCFILEFC